MADQSSDNASEASGQSADLLLALSPELLHLTFDQLRTLIFLRSKGSALKAALALRRDQSSVQKQLQYPERPLSGSLR